MFRAPQYPPTSLDDNQRGALVDEWCGLLELWWADARELDLTGTMWACLDLLETGVWRNVGWERQADLQLVWQALNGQLRLLGFYH